MKMDITALLTINATVIIAVIVLVSLKYGTVLHPVSFLGAQFSVWTVLSPLLYLRLRALVVSEDGLKRTLLLSALYCAALGVAYWLKFSPLRSPLEALVRVSRPFIIAKRSDLTGLGMKLLV